uniref:DNA-binding protein n=1 Tax=Thermofilum pendens TaxID=2269 RepID=A0A7C4FEI0_THEPE
MSLAVADTCLLINWLSFRRWEDIFRLSHRVLLPGIMVPELRSERVKSRVEELAYRGRLVILPRVDYVDREALRIFNLINSTPGLPRIDEPEAYGLAYAALHGIPFLTDNASPKVAARSLSSLRGVVVYDSLDLLVMLYRGSELRSAVEEFMSDTSVTFSKERLREAGVEL